MTRTQRWITLAASVLSAGVALSIVVVSPTGKPSGTQDNPECPHDWGWMTQTVSFGGVGAGTGQGELIPELLQSGQGAPSTGEVTTTDVLVQNPDVPLDGFAISGMKTNVPEFHDCQKLRTVDAAGAPGFGPLAAVFAKEQLSQISADSLAAGVILGMVYLPQGGQYAQLGISKRFSCIAVKSGAAGLQAWVVGVETEDRCDGTFGSLGIAAASTLAVRASKPTSDRRPLAIPAVARWDWDAATNTQFIGIRCADAWCEIGMNGFGPSLSYTYALLSSPIEQRNFAVKGWYDEQFLAEDVPEGIAPSNIRGTVVPTSGSERFKRSAGVAGEWTPVAVVYTRSSPGSYDESFHFVGGTNSPPSGERVLLEMCRGDWKSCSPSRFRFLNPFSCARDANGTRWYARVIRNDSSRRYYCTLFRAHPHDFDIPAVARWRWRKNDETIWISCPQGCCEVNADE